MQIISGIKKELFQKDRYTILKNNLNTLNINHSKAKSMIDFQKKDNLLRKN